VERAGRGDLLARISGDVAVVSTATRTALPALVIAGIGPRHLAGIIDRSAAVRDVSLRVARVQAWFTSHLNAAELTGVAGLLVAGFALVRSDTVTVGTAGPPS
jgi:hypothetical protein